MSGVTFFSPPQFTLSFNGNSVLGVNFPTSVRSVLLRQQYDMSYVCLVSQSTSDKSVFLCQQCVMCHVSQPLRFRVSFCGIGGSGVTFHHQVRKDSLSSSSFSLSSSGSK